MPNRFEFLFFLFERSLAQECTVVYGMDNTMGCGSSQQTHTMHATPRPDQLAEPTVPTSSAPAIPAGLVAAPNPSTPDPVIPAGPTQKELTATDDLKQALDDALKDVDDMKKKLDSSLPLSSTSGLPADSASAAALLRAEAAEGQLADLQGHFNALLQVLSRRCGNNRD
jgi:hypothetical protein